MLLNDQEEDIKHLLNRLRLLVDGVEGLNKRYSQWTELEIVQYAFPIVTYCSELMEILYKDEHTDIRHRNELLPER